jgi:hypothetical protein
LNDLLVLKIISKPNYFEVGPQSKVVDLFKLYTFDFGHIFIRAIFWKEILLYSELLELSQIYEQVLIFFLLLSPLCFSAAPPTAHRRHFSGRQLPLSSLFLRHLAPSSPVRRLTDPAGSSSCRRVALLLA